MTDPLLCTLGEESAAKIDFLRAGARQDPDTGRFVAVGVNRRHCRPLHPYGARLVRDGLMRLVRAGSDRSRNSALVITDKGLTELARLEKRLAKRARKDAASPQGRAPGAGGRPWMRTRDQVRDARKRAAQDARHRKSARARKAAAAHVLAGTCAGPFS